MKKHTALLFGLLFLFAGAALATPTAGEAPGSDAAAFLADWGLDSPAATDGYALAPQAPIQEPTELAVYWPCGCTPIPGCPFPIPWPQPGGPTIFNPFPPIGPCGPCPF